WGSTPSRAVCAADRRSLTGEKAPLACCQRSGGGGRLLCPEPDRMGGPGGQRLAGQGRPGPPCWGGSFPSWKGGGLARSEATMRRGGGDRLAAPLFIADRTRREASFYSRSPLL